MVLTIFIVDTYDFYTMRDAPKNVGFIPKEWPEIRTERLILRPLREEDARDVHEMRSRNEVMSWRSERYMNLWL